MVRRSSGIEKINDMRRNVKNYLCVLLLISTVYFMSMTYLRAEETRTRLIRIERTEDVSLPTGWYLLTAAQGLIIFVDAFYLIASKGNRKTFKQTMKSVPVRVIGGLSALGGGSAGIMLSVGLIGAMPALEMPHLNLPEEKVAQGEPEGEEEQTYVFPVPELPPLMPVENLASQANGVLVISDAQDLSEQAISDQSDISAILAAPGAQLSLVGSSIVKSGDASSPENAMAYGLNAGLFVREGAAANIMGSLLSTAANGSPGAAANGSGAVLSISDSNISTSGAFSPAVMSLFQGSVTCGNDQISTSEAQSPVLVARANGSINASGGGLYAYGPQSTLIYGDGKFELNSVYGQSSGGSLMFLQNGAEVSLNGCTMSASGLYSDGLEGGIYINGFDENGREKKMMVNLNSNSLSLTQSGNGDIPIPMFHTVGGQTQINLSNSSLRIPSGLFGYVEGGKTEMNLDMQSAYGSYVVDGSASLNLQLLNSSSYTGIINTENTGAEVNLHIDASSTLSLTGDIYLSSFTDDQTDYSNIAFNGYMIYVQGNPIL